VVLVEEEDAVDFVALEFVEEAFVFKLVALDFVVAFEWMEEGALDWVVGRLVVFVATEDVKDDPQDKCKKELSLE
jgi:hypothetical protein